MASTLSGSSVTKLMIKLNYAGKRLLLPPSSTPELLSVLAETEEILSMVKQLPSESIANAMHPMTEALVAKELVRHHLDMDVNISVACCICEILRIMAPENPYNAEQMKDFFELVVITFEKLSCASGGCYIKMTKVLEIFSNTRLSVLMLDPELDGFGLVVRLFKQFLTVAGSNSSAIVLKMEKIMTMIIEETEELAPDLVGVIVRILEKENQIASLVCWQLGEKVLMNFAAQFNPHLPVMGQDMSIALYDYSKIVAHIRKTASEKDIVEAKEEYNSLRDTYTTNTNKLRKGTTQRSKFECLEGIRNMVQTVGWCQHRTKDVVNQLGIHSKKAKKREKKSLSFDDPPMLLKSVTEVKVKHRRNHTQWKKQAQSIEHGGNLVGCRIEVWWPLLKMYYKGVVKFFDCIKKRHKVLYDNGDEELLDLKAERWKLLENVATVPNYDPPMLPKSVTKVKGKCKGNDGPWKKVAQSDEYGENLVGSRIKVWWPQDEMYYHGAVKSFDLNTKRHKVLYDDGDEEFLNLKRLRWKLFIPDSVLYNNGDEELLNLKAERWKLLENMPVVTNFEAKQIIPYVSEVSKPRKDKAHKINVEYLKTENHCQHEKETLSYHDRTMLPKSITEMKGKRKKSDGSRKKVAQFEEHAENLVGSWIKVWWPKDEMYYQGVVHSFDFNTKKHKILYDDGDEEVLNLKRQRWKLFKNVSAIPDSVLSDNGDEELLNLKAERWKLLENVPAVAVPNSEAKQIIPYASEVSKPRKDKTHKINVELLKTVSHCQHEKETLSFHDPPMLPKSVTKVKGKRKRSDGPWKKVARPEEHAENLVGNWIKVWWPKDEMYYQGVVHSFDFNTKRHKILYDDGDEEVLNLKRHQWELFKNVSSIPDSEAKEIISHTSDVCKSRKDKTQATGEGKTQVNSP